MIKLYQFPISHYCEIARWALDYKQVDHEKINLLPGLHLKVTKGLVPKTSVPFITCGDKAIQGSGEIITWLDEQYPQRKLTPVPSAEKQAALEWENYLDKSVGVPLRLFLYHYLLDQPSAVLPLITTGQGGFTKFKYKFMFPKVRKVMRKFMNINDESAAKARKTLLGALDRLDAAHEKSRFLAGGAFSRADLVAASLWAPLLEEPKYGLQWPDNMPEQIAEFAEECRPRLQWVSEFYREFR